jgi:hypothetical protein
VEKSQLYSRLFALLLTSSFGAFAQAPDVKSWQISPDGDIRTQISLKSAASAKNAAVLLIECNRPANNRKPSIGIYLIPGRLEPHPRTGILNSVSEWLLRIKLDDGKPVLRSWTPVGQTGSYAYEGEGENALASEFVSPKRFLQELLAAKAFDVQLQKAGETAPHVASFDTRQLEETFTSQSACEGQ